MKPTSVRAEPEMAGGETGRFLPLLQPHWGVLGYRLVLMTLAAGGVVLQHGFHQTPLPDAARDWILEHFGIFGFVHIIHALQGVLLTLYFADIFARTARGDEPDAHPRINWVDYSMLGFAVAGVIIGSVGRIDAGWWLFKLVLIWALIVELWRMQKALVRHFAQPGIVLPLSFLILITACTILLKLPVARPVDTNLSWIDSLFTATSAVCITGLVVHDTGTHFSPTGQAIIATFIQLGGLGIILFGSLVALMLGHSMSIRERQNLSQFMGDLPQHRLQTMVAFIVFSTLAIEAVGALLLFPLWTTNDGTAMPLRTRIGMSVFHAISAYCNAGFDLTGASMIPYRHHPLAHGVIMPLVVLGGLGYPVLSNLGNIARHRYRRWRHPRRPGEVGPVDLSRQRLSLHSRLVLLTTLIVFLLGFVAILASFAIPQATSAPETAAPVGEAGMVQHPVTAGRVLGRVIDSSFMSLTARTAGFTSVPMEEIQPAASFTLMTLMFVGGSPGGTAGGVKTTVVALLALSVISTIRQRRETEVFNRTIADSLIRRAATILACFAAMIVLGAILLLMSERLPFEQVLFEAVSAGTTTGLSLGITGELSTFGKAVLVVMMFLGRVGPLALMGMLVIRRGPQRPYSYPHEDVALG